MSDDAAGRLLVLAKAPVPGRVKTRLCPPCTPGQAAGLAAAALADTLDAVCAAATASGRMLALDGELADPVVGVEVVGQRGEGLAARIGAAFADASGADGLPTLQIGMDTPQVDGPLLDRCLRRLRSPDVDAVLGPADDGGWWAMGLRDPSAAGLLAAVPMSTPDTGWLTLAALRRAGLRVAPLPVLRDVDEWPDALAVAAAAPHGRFAAAMAALGTAVPAVPAAGGRG